MKKDDEVVDIFVIDGMSDIVFVIYGVYVFIFYEEEVSLVGVRVVGVKVINLKEDDYVVFGKLLNGDKD